MLDFSVLKRIARSLADEIDHKVLLPTQNPKLAYRTVGDMLHVDYFGKPTYVFPASDCALLPIQNSTAEMLAQYLALRLRDGAGEGGLHPPHAARTRGGGELRPVGHLSHVAGPRLTRRGDRCGQGAPVQCGRNEHAVASTPRQRTDVRVASHPAPSQQHHLRQRPAQRCEQPQVQADAAPHPADIQQDERPRPGLDRRRAPAPPRRPTPPPPAAPFVVRGRSFLRSRLNVTSTRAASLARSANERQGLEPDDDVTECAAEALEVVERGDAGIEQQRTAEALGRPKPDEEVELRRRAADGIEVGDVAALHAAGSARYARARAIASPSRPGARTDRTGP